MNGALAGARLARVADAKGVARVGVLDGAELGLLAGDDIPAILERGELPDVIDRISIVDQETVAPAAPWTLLTPVVAPETWAAGVTYKRSREARRAESQGRDVYDLIYDAERPELFLKDAGGRRTVGPGAPIATRANASWTVPGPDL